MIARVHVADVCCNSSCSPTFPKHTSKRASNDTRHSLFSPPHAGTLPLTAFPVVSDESLVLPLDLFSKLLFSSLSLHFVFWSGSVSASSVQWLGLMLVSLFWTPQTAKGAGGERRRNTTTVTRACVCVSMHERVCECPCAEATLPHRYCPSSSPCSLPTAYVVAGLPALFCSLVSSARLLSSLSILFLL